MPFHAVATLVTVVKMNMMNTLPCGCGTLKTDAVRIWHQVSLGACTEVSTALAVSRRSAPSFPLLSNSPADLHRGLCSSKVDYFNTQIS
jgi:hypothetical protein